MIPTFTREGFNSANGRPTSVTVKSVLTHEGEPDLGDTVIALAEYIRLSVRQAVSRFKPSWTASEINSRTKGWLTAMNIVNGSVKAYEKTITNVNENITAAALLNIVSSIQQSNQDIRITELEWQFSFDANMFLSGGGTYKKPSWAPKKFKATWEDYPDVSCAAFALVYMMNHVRRKYREYPQRAINDAKALQEKLGWGKHVALSELDAFVEEYPQYRVCVFTPGHVGKFSVIFTGSEFDELVAAASQPTPLVTRDSDHIPDLCDDTSDEPSDEPSDDPSDDTLLTPLQVAKKNTLFLVLNMANGNHYAATNSPAQVLLANKFYGIRFCFHCLETYRHSSSHTCTGTHHVPKRRKPAPCSKGCGEIGIHQCQFTTCKNCAEVYKSSDGEGFNHRCFLFKSDKKQTYEQGNGDGKNPNLWVYDLEARVEIKQSTVKKIVGFKVCQDDPNSFVDGECRTDIAVYEYSCHTQKANLVVAKNIFTDETKIFEGDECLRDFLVFALDYNKGNNIFVAHNGSGYDTRLIYAAAIKLASKVKLSSTNRGTKFMNLMVDKLKFIDSMLHVQGSIKSLSKSFCPGHLRKGNLLH